jgi:hypothetical protein
MIRAPLAVGAVGDVLATSLMWRYGGQLHLCVTVRARYALVDDGVAERIATQGVANLAPADDVVPYRDSCDVWMVGHCHGQPLSPDAPMTTRLSLLGGREQLLDRQHRLLKGSDLGVAGYGPRRTNKRLEELIVSDVVEIPRSFDWSKLHATPPNQRVRYLEGGEHITIENVLEQGKMRCRLPHAAGEAQIWSRGSRPTDAGYPIHLAADTLGIDADTASMTIVWRGSFPIDDAAVPARLIIAAAVRENDAIDWEEGWVMANTAALAEGAATGSTLELTPDVKPERPAVPFDPGRPSQPEGEALRPANIEGAPWSEREPSVPKQRERQMTVDLEEGFDVDAAPLPFRPREADPVSKTDPVFDISANETMETVPKTSPREATPFETSGEWDTTDGED